MNNYKADFLGDNGFHYFFGRVEDIQDPQMIGRVRIRIFGVHSPNANDMPTEDLPWAIVSFPITSASVNGVSVSTGLELNSLVWGFFLDGYEKQYPMVCGSINTSAMQIPERVFDTFPVLGPDPSEAYATIPHDSVTQSNPYECGQPIRNSQPYISPNNTGPSEEGRRRAENFGRRIEENQGSVEAIRQASSQEGVDFGYLMAIAATESGYRRDAQNPYSSAGGLFQFIDSTWGSYAGDRSTRGLSQNKYDPLANATSAALYTRDNRDFLISRARDANGNAIFPTEQSVTPGTLYSAHWLGAGGARSFHEARIANPNSSGVDFFRNNFSQGDSIVANHPAFLYNEDGSEKTLGEVQESLERYVPAADFNALYGDETTQLATAEEDIDTTYEGVECLIAQTEPTNNIGDISEFNGITNLGTRYEVQQDGTVKLTRADGSVSYGNPSTIRYTPREYAEFYEDVELGIRQNRSIPPERSVQPSIPNGTRPIPNENPVAASSDRPRTVVPSGSGSGFLVPCDGYVTSIYGPRNTGISGASRTHKGVDIGNQPGAIGTPIYAAESGRVEYAGWGSGYGHFIKIVHPSGLETRYAHLRGGSLLVSSGDSVQRGQMIGEMGNSGISGGPHLHFEIRSNGEAIDPSDFHYPFGNRRRSGSTEKTLTAKESFRGGR